MTDIRLEVWDRPGTTGFGRRIAKLETITDSARLQPVNGIGEGKASVPDSFSRIDEVVRVDPATPANYVRSMIRAYLDGQVSGTDAPYAEWLPDQVIPPSESETGRFEVSGLGREAMIRDAVVEPWDWNGEADFRSSWPDWIYGGRDLLSPVQTVFKPHIFHVWVVPTGGAISGTLDIGVSKDGSAFEQATVAWNAAAEGGAGSVEGELESLSYGLDVEVTGFGTEANPWEISILSPSAVQYQNSQSTGALVNAVARGSLKQFGRLLPVGWELSRLDNTSIPHGWVTDFRASLGTGSDPALPAGCPVWIVFNGTEPWTPGVQTIPLKVIPGGIYQLPDDMILRAWGAGALVRVVVRDLDENVMFDINGNDAFEELNLVADTNTPITGIPDIMIPQGVSQIIVRVGHIGTGDPPTISIACPALIEGFEASTVGKMVADLYTDWTTNHAADPYPLSYWVHGDGGFYLALDFDAVNDSGGNPWPRLEKMTIKRGERFDTVLNKIIKLGYEWRVVPAATDGYWLLQIFAVNTMTTDYSAAKTPTIRGGRDVTRRPLRRWLAKTGALIEGADQFFSHAASTAAQAVLGVSTEYATRPDFEAEAAVVAAGQQVDDQLRRTRSLLVNIADVTDLVGPPPPVPGRDYVPGDIVRVIDPPEIVDDPERVWSILYTRTEEGLSWEVQLGNQSFADSGGSGASPGAGAGAGGGGVATTEGVRYLLEEQELVRDRPPPPPDRPPEPGCCPTCIANVVGFVDGTMSSGFTALAWLIDNDPNGIMAEGTSGQLKFVQPGIYTVDFDFEMRHTLSTAGITTWRLRATAAGNDAGNAWKDKAVFRPTTGVIVVQDFFSYKANLAESGGVCSFDYALQTTLSSGVVTANTGVLVRADLTVMRHSDGCARIQGSG